MSHLDEQEFRRHADDALTKLYRVLTDASDDYGFDADLQDGAITIELDDPPGKFVISPNTPARQVWVAARSKSYKLDWDEVQSTFVLGETGPTLKTLVEEALGKHIGEEVNL